MPEGNPHFGQGQAELTVPAFEPASENEKADDINAQEPPDHGIDHHHGKGPVDFYQIDMDAEQ